MISEPLPARPGFYEDTLTGDLVELLEEARHVHSHERMVVYRLVRDGQVYLRPYVEWIEWRPTDRGPLRRFTFVSAPGARLESMETRV